MVKKNTKHLSQAKKCQEQKMKKNIIKLNLIIEI